MSVLRVILVVASLILPSFSDSFVGSVTVCPRGSSHGQELLNQSDKDHKVSALYTVL
jgi:hypothetical protein